MNGNVASFSSYGPTFDGRVKPDVSSVGWGTYLISSAGNPQKGNGTSYSNPNMAGLVTCLWQAFPEFRNTEITDAGLAHLKDVTSLRELNLIGTKITDAGVAHLKGLTKLQQLKPRLLMCFLD